MPSRVQRKRVKGWTMPPNTVSVCRPGPYGNPYRVGRDGTAQECVNKFRADWVEAIAKAKRDRAPYMPFGKPIYLGPLIGKNLACWCAADAPCHADVLLALVSPPTNYECEDCIGMIEHGCYCQAMGAVAPGGPLEDAA